ncbi:MAG: hypothetical protein QXR26_03770 [Candidatus Caldarchaeum sp.]
MERLHPPTDAYQPNLKISKFSKTPYKPTKYMLNKQKHLLNKLIGFLNNAGYTSKTINKIKNGSLTMISDS